MFTKSEPWEAPSLSLDEVRAVLKERLLIGTRPVAVRFAMGSETLAEFAERLPVPSVGMSPYVAAAYACPGIPIELDNEPAHAVRVHYSDGSARVIDGRTGATRA